MSDNKKEIIVSWHPREDPDGWTQADILFLDGDSWKSKGSGESFSWLKVVELAAKAGATLKVWDHDTVMTLGPVTKEIES